MEKKRMQDKEYNYCSGGAKESVEHYEKRSFGIWVEYKSWRN